MKGKMRIMGVLLVVLCIAIPLTTMAYSESDKPNENISFEGVDLRFDEVESYNITKAFFVENQRDIIEERAKYTDEKGNTYVFVDDELIAYWMPDFGVDSSENKELIGKDECLSTVKNTLQTVIKEYNNFDITSFNESSGGYRVLLHNEKSKFLQDTLTVQVGNDGAIKWLVVDYSELSDVSDNQIKAANELLENYIKNYSKEFSSYETDLNFRLIGKDTIATYIISFKDSEGFYFCDVVSFVL